MYKKMHIRCQLLDEIDAALLSQGGNADFLVLHLCYR